MEASGESICINKMITINITTFTFTISSVACNEGLVTVIDVVTCEVVFTKKKGNGLNFLMVTKQVIQQIDTPELV